MGLDTSSVEPHNKSSQLSSDQVQHHSNTAKADKLFRHKHLQADERTADINDIKRKLKLPPANDEAIWKDTDEEISSAFDTFLSATSADGTDAMTPEWLRLKPR